MNKKLRTMDLRARIFLCNKRVPITWAPRSYEWRSLSGHMYTIQWLEKRAHPSLVSPHGHHYSASRGPTSARAVITRTNHRSARAHPAVFFIARARTNISRVKTEKGSLQTYLVFVIVNVPSEAGRSASNK